VLRALRTRDAWHGGENREPTLDDVAHLLGKPVEQVRKVLGYNEHVTSLDAPMDADGGASVIEQLADDDAEPRAGAAQLGDRGLDQAVAGRAVATPA
jgi:RNA polymerase nonessential primary-like sigma factor